MKIILLMPVLILLIFNFSCTTAQVERVGGLVNLSNEFNEAGLKDNIQFGSNHACMLRGQTLSCWGSNMNNRLGVRGANFFATPQVVPGLGNVQEFAVGKTHTCALLEDQRVMCWGGNSKGQVGCSHSPGVECDALSVRVPTAVTTTNYPNSYLKIFAVGDLTCGVHENRNLLCWGDTDEGYRTRLARQGRVTLRNAGTPIRFREDAGLIRDVFGGDNYFCTINTVGALRCHGLLSSNVPVQEQPVRYAGNSISLQAIKGEGGASHFCFVERTQQGRQAVQCMGGSHHGEAGILRPERGQNNYANGATAAQRTIEGSIAPQGVTITDLALGEDYSCASYSNGELRCWGKDLESVGGAPLREGQVVKADTNVARLELTHKAPMRHIWGLRNSFVFLPQEQGRGPYLSGLGAMNEIFGFENPEGPKSIHPLYNFVPVEQ